jgi:predicted transcriptional regulator
MLATIKQEALEAIERLPDNSDIESMMYRLYVIENVRRGQQDSEQGNTYTSEEVFKEMQTW